MKTWLNGLEKLVLFVGLFVLFFNGKSVKGASTLGKTKNGESRILRICDSDYSPRF